MTIKNAKKAMLAIQDFDALSKQASKLTDYEREQADTLVRFSSELLGAYLAGLEYYQMQRFGFAKLKLHKTVRAIERRVRLFMLCAIDYINKVECAFTYHDFSVLFAKILVRFEIGVGFQMRKKQLTYTAYHEPQQTYLIDVVTLLNA